MSLNSTTPTIINYHLTDHQRHCITDDFIRGYSVQEIFDKWEVNVHQRPPPSIQSIYGIRKEWVQKDRIQRKKSGPKKRTILTPEKLDEIGKVVEQDPFITGDALAKAVKIPRKTCLDGVKVLKLKKFKAIESPWLTEVHCEQRLSFCRAYRCWNQEPQMSIWWTDESIFKVEELFNYNHQTYYASTNLHLEKEKPRRTKSVNVWAGIRGDGKILFRILVGIQTSKKYKEMLKELLGEMEPDNSFFMQDGAGHHTGGKAIKWLNKRWKNRWIGQQSPRLEWPPYSMDLTPLDFSFWHYVKFQVSLLNPTTRAELIDAISGVMKSVPPTIITSICQEVKERCGKCIAVNGDRFEE
jgi:hypothetical protein